MLVFEFKTYTIPINTILFVLAEGFSFQALRINSTANGTLLHFAATGRFLLRFLGLIMLLLLWILWLLLGNDKSALNALDFANILPRRFVLKPELFKSTKIPTVTYLLSDRLATIKLFLTKLLVVNKIKL